MVGVLGYCPPCVEELTCLALLDCLKPLPLRTGVKEGDTEERVHVVGMTEKKATSAEDAIVTMQAGSALRATEPTQRNPDRCCASPLPCGRCPPADGRAHRWMSPPMEEHAAPSLFLTA